jgi:hypothetical protein
VLRVDESAEKAGDKSAGVGKQYNGRMGKVETSPVGVLLSSVNLKVAQGFWTWLERGRADAQRAIRRMTFGPWRRLVVVWIAFIRRNTPRGASALLFRLTRVIQGIFGTHWRKASYPRFPYGTLWAGAPFLWQGASPAYRPLACTWTSLPFTLITLHLGLLFPKAFSSEEKGTLFLSRINSPP